MTDTPLSFVNKTSSSYATPYLTTNNVSIFVILINKNQSDRTIIHKVRQFHFKEHVKQIIPEKKKNHRKMLHPTVFENCFQHNLTTFKN